MTAVLKTIIIDSDAGTRTAMRRLLAGFQSVVVVAEYSDVAEALLGAPAQRADAAFLEIGNNVAPIERLARSLPETAILVTGPATSADFVIKAIRAGALEFLHRPVERPELFAALEKIGRVRRGSPPTQRSARVTSVFSTKGGLGASTLAINLAVCLAERHGGATLLVELDTRPSDVATFLDLRPTYSIIDALESLDRMDETFLQGLLAKHESGLWVLPGPSRMERSPINAEGVQGLLEILKSHFDHIVLDLRHDLDRPTVVALEASEAILFLTCLNVAALRSGAAGLAAFRQLGIDPKNVRGVVMRDGTGSDVTMKHAREVLDIPLFWRTPNDYATVVRAINHGRPLVKAAPRSKIATSLRDLAEALTRAGAPATRPARRRGAALLRLAWSPRGLPGAR